MELGEYKNTKHFLITIFQFFKDYKIESSLQKINDYVFLLHRILKSEFINFHYHPGIYSIDFKLRDKTEESEIYMLLFGNDSNNKNGYLLIDLGENDLISFITFSFELEKHPPLLFDFLDKNEKLNTRMVLMKNRILMVLVL